MWAARRSSGRSVSRRPGSSSGVSSPVGAWRPRLRSSSPGYRSFWPARWKRRHPRWHPPPAGARGGSAARRAGRGRSRCACDRARLPRRPQGGRRAGAGSGRRGRHSVARLVVGCRSADRAAALAEGAGRPVGDAPEGARRGCANRARARLLGGAGAAARAGSSQPGHAAPSAQATAGARADETGAFARAEDVGGQSVLRARARP
jgi:hypothetical protein